MKAFLIAGEPSGDKLGGALMAGLKKILPDTSFSGVGGSEMAAQGMKSLFPMEELSVMGLVEVLPRYRALMRRIDETAAKIITDKPDVLITIDSPDFCLRVAKRVRAAAPEIRTVHYVAPSVWAWRKGRAAKMAEHIDQVLALLPFEPPFMEAVGMRCDFVGHPVVSEPEPSVADCAALRRDLGIGSKDSVLLVLPGSRKGEVDRLSPVFGGAVRLIAEDRPDLRILIPAAGPVAELVQEKTRDWAVQPIILDPRGYDTDQAAARKRAAFKTADLALAASGTVSLELAAAGTPMVIAYDLSWLSWQIMSRLVRVDTVTLVNLVTGAKSIPEFLGPACRPDPIAKALLDLLNDEKARTSQIEAMQEAMKSLGRGGEDPGTRAAKAVLDGLKT